MQQNLASNSVENMTLRAPFDGIVLEKYFDVGGVVSAGMPIMSMTSIEGMKVIVSLDTDIFSLKMGDTVFLNKVSENKSFTGQIVSLSPVKDTQTNKNSLEIRIPD